MSIPKRLARFGLIVFVLVAVLAPTSARADTIVGEPWCPPQSNTWAPWSFYCVEENNGTADHHAEQFWRGSDNALWHRWVTSSGAWSSAASLHGGLKGSPTVARNADGRLEVFITGTDSHLYHIWQTQVGCCWSSWSSLGGTLTSNPRAWKNYGSDLRLEVFGRGTDNAIYTIWQLSNQQGTGWSTWYDLGGIATSRPSVYPLSLNGDPRLGVEVIGSNGTSHYRRDQKTLTSGSGMPGGGWYPWILIS